MAEVETVFIACNASGERILGKIQESWPKPWQATGIGECIQIEDGFARAVPVADILKRPHQDPPRVEYLFALDSIEITELARNHGWSSIETIDNQEP